MSQRIDDHVLIDCKFVKEAVRNMPYISSGSADIVGIDASVQVYFLRTSYVDIAQITPG